LRLTDRFPRPLTRPRPLPSLPAVLIDASALTSVAAGSGIGTYVRNLLAALAAVPELNIAVSVLAEPAAAMAPGIERRPIHRRCKERARVEVVEHAIRLPWDDRMRRRGGEVFHEPGFHAPWGIRGPKVQTLHDVIPLVLDEPDVAALRQRWQRFGPRYRSADAVIAVSRHAADEGIRVLGIDPARIFVAHHGVDPVYWPGEPAERCGPAEQGGPPYLLAVGEYSRRKGFGEAFAVMDALADAGYPHVLKVVGRIHAHARDELEALRAAARRPDRIELLGHVPDLAAVYRAAAALLMTTRYEGFGLPAVEAMASGTPVVAFANTAVAEIVAGGGVLVADGDVAAMVAALRCLLDSPAAADEIRQQGLGRAAEFTWAKSAAIHAEVYRMVAAGPG
jgi:glycosyltransferase involved in cell wall biosynthesis